jgi:hypothetical protein
VTVVDSSLSRVHARVAVSNDGVLAIEDLGSTNGVFVDDVRQARVPLTDGQRVRLGVVEWAVSCERLPEAEPTDRTIFRAAIPQEVPKTVDRVALEALLATSRDLMAFSDLPGLLDRALDRLQAILKPDRSAILLLDPDTGVLRPRSVRPAGAYRSVSEFASATVVSEALAAREVLVVSDALQDRRLQQAESVIIANVRSVVCVPLMGRAGAIGALYADRRGIGASFAPEQVEYAAAFAAHAAAAVETAQLYEDQERHFRATLEAFARALDARDRYTSGHSERVTAYTLALARAQGFDDVQIETIRRAAMLHDIGKVGVSDAVLLKPGPLEGEERSAMMAHSVIGCRMLEALPFLRASLPAIRGHHERYDGEGYPDRIARDAIHPHARLMAVADSFDAMTSARPYRSALPIEEAARRIRADRGCQFDAAAIDVFDEVEAQFAAIQRAGVTTRRYEGV